MSTIKPSFFYSTYAPEYYGRFPKPIDVVYNYKSEVQAAAYQANLEAYSRLNSPDFAGWTLIMEAKETVKWLREIALKATTITRRFLSQLDEYESRQKGPKNASIISSLKILKDSLMEELI